MTSLSPRRFHFALGALFLAVVALTFVLARVAHAQTTPDPIPTATDASAALISLLLAYGPVWGGMAILFGFASSVLKRNESTHWIAQGRTLAAIAAVVALGIAALEAHFGDAPWAGVVLTVIVGAFKLIDPTVAAKPATPSSSATGPLALVRARVAELEARQGGA